MYVFKSRYYTSPHEKMRASDNHMHCVESIISQYVNVDKAISDVKKRLKADQLRQQLPSFFFFRDRYVKLAHITE